MKGFAKEGEEAIGQERRVRRRGMRSMLLGGSACRQESVRDVEDEAHGVLFVVARDHVEQAVAVYVGHC